MKTNIGVKLFRDDKMYGTTVVGTKGQVVIPIAARKDLKLKPGDTLVVMGKMGTAIGLIKAEQLSELVHVFMSNMEKLNLGSFRKEFEKRAGKLLGKLKKS